MFFPDNMGIQNTRCRVKGIDGRINTQFGDLTRQYGRCIQMGECCCRSRVGQVIGRNINGLYRCNRPFLRRRNTFLQGADVCAQCRLITYGRRNTTEQSRYFRTGLNETENVINEQQYILMFFITEVFRHSKTRKAYTHTSSGRFVHLTVYQSGLTDNARFLHFVPQVVTFTCTFTYTRKYGVTAVFRCNVVNQFHNKDRLTYTGTAEEADFTALGIRSDEVNDLNPCFQNFHLRRQVVKFRCRTVNRPIIIGLYRFIHLINRFAEDVENTPQHALSYRNTNGGTRIFSSHTANQTVRRAHSNATYYIVAQMLHDFGNEIYGLVAFAACNADSRVNRR